MSLQDKAKQVLNELIEAPDDVLGALSNKEIAQRMGIETHTVKQHMWRIMEKLGVKTRYELISKYTPRLPRGNL